MCSRINCRSCGKPGWAGCGAHIEAVLRDVPPDKRCKCRPERPTPVSLFSLFGRR